MEALPVSPLTRDTLEERVYAQIRDALMEGRFAAGQPITLRALARALGVSLTPIRHALSRLVAEGALIGGPNRTLTVPTLTPAAFEEITAMRLLLEGLAAERAAGRIDEAGISELERLCDVMDQAYEAQDPLGALRAGPVVPIVIEKSRREHFVPKDPKHPHRLVVAALRQRDGKAAKRALVCDISWAADVIVKHLV